MDPDTKMKTIYCATFGAYFAAQVHARVQSGQGAPDDDDYARYAEEANEVANTAVSMVRGYP